MRKRCARARFISEPSLPPRGLRQLKHLEVKVIRSGCWLQYYSAELIRFLAGVWGRFPSRLFTLHESDSEIQMKSRRYFLNPSFLHSLHCTFPQFRFFFFFSFCTILCTAVSFMERRRHVDLNRLDVTHRDRIFLQLFQLCHIPTRCYWRLSVLISLLGAFGADEMRYCNGTAIDVKSLKFGEFSFGAITADSADFTMIFTAGGL